MGDDSSYEVRYALKIAVSGNGSTLPAAGNYAYDEGLRVSIKAIPDSGWKFDIWTGDVADPTLSETMVTMVFDKTVTAHFSQIKHDLKIAVSGNGSTTPEAGTHSYNEGTVVNITAKADSGWEFDSWTGDAADPTSSETTVTMVSDKTVTANFSKVKPSLWLISGITAGIIIISATTWLAFRRKSPKHQ